MHITMDSMFSVIGRRRTMITLFLGLAILALSWGYRPASAASIVVNATADKWNSDGDCSLREALAAANSDAAVDTCNPGSGDDIISIDGLNLWPGTAVLLIRTRWAWIVRR